MAVMAESLSSMLTGRGHFDPSGDTGALVYPDTATTSGFYHASDGAVEASATLSVTVSAIA